MSYNGYPGPYGGPPPSHSPQSGYASPPGPPPGQYNQGPPQGAYPHQGAYPPPQQPPPQSYGAPPAGGYPPPHGGYGAPPQGQWGQPPLRQQGYGQPPSGPYAQVPPPTPPYSGSFPPAQGYPHGGQFPTQGGLAAPPPGNYPMQQQISGLRACPSPGYDPHMVPSIDMTHVAHTVGDATKRIVTNHTKLIEVLAKLDPLQIAALKQAYTIHIKQNLEKDLDDKTSGHYREGMLAIARGPLLQDVHCVHKAIKGLGTDEGMLNDVLVGRSNADMRAIIAAYQQTLGKDMVKDVKRDLSLETKDHFNEILKATRNEESSPCDPQDIEQAVNTFHNIAGTKTGSGVKAVSKIMTNRSDGQIRAIAQEYQLRFRTPLDAVIRDRFSGHMKDALLLQLARATDRAKSDAMQLEDAMKGLGTKDELLVQRVVRVHWDRQHLGQVKLAYSHIYKRDLVARVKGETSGNYKKLMEECLI